MSPPEPVGDAAPAESAGASVPRWASWRSRRWRFQLFLLLGDLLGPLRGTDRCERVKNLEAATPELGRLIALRRLVGCTAGEAP